MKHISAIDAYMAKVYKGVIIISLLSTVLASLNFAVMKLLGFYASTTWTSIIILGGTNIIYILVGMYLTKNAVEDGIVQPKMMRYGKIYMLIIITIQFNFLLHLVPSRIFWGFTFYFLFLTVFFLDHRLVGLTALSLTVSIIINFILHPDTNLPVKDETFMPELNLLITALALSMLGIYIFTRWAAKNLIDAKKDEIEQNNNRTNQILHKAKDISERLSDTSTKVLENAEVESAATEELSSISEELSGMSKSIIKHNNESTNNLNLLKQCSENVSFKVKKSTEMSDELVQISEESEQDLNNLLTVSDEVVSANDNTMKAIERLLKGTKKIGNTVNIINEIAASTNLLALNASIEAARAGDTGKGFAVVANEIGNLSGNTQNSIREIDEVVKALEIEANAVTDSISMSSDKLNYQNEVLEKTVQKIKDMMKLLHSSLDVIKEVDVLNGEQVALIGTTFSYNENISKQIEVEDEQFSNIVGVVQNSTSGIVELTNQVDKLNDIVRELEGLLKN